MTAITWIEILLLTFLVVAAVSACVVKRLLTAVIIFSTYGVIMSILWIFLASPDLAITEAAVGAGINSALYFVVLKRIQIMEQEHHGEEQKNR